MGTEDANSPGPQVFWDLRKQIDWLESQLAAEKQKNAELEAESKSEWEETYRKVIVKRDSQIASLESSLEGMKKRLESDDMSDNKQIARLEKSVSELSEENLDLKLKLKTAEDKLAAVTKAHCICANCIGSPNAGTVYTGSTQSHHHQPGEVCMCHLKERP